MSQEYEKDKTVQYKSRKETLPKITSPAMMGICEVRDKFPDGTSPDVMEDFLNKNLCETNKEISEHDNETNRDSMKIVIEEFPDGCDDNEREEMSEKKEKKEYTELLLKRKKKLIRIPCKR